MPIEAVVFDLDNTLINRKAAFEVFANKIINSHLEIASVERRRDALARIIEADGDGYRRKEEFFNEIQDTYGWKNGLTFEAYMDFWFNEFPKCSVLMDGALDILEHFKNEKVKLGLITNGAGVTQNGKIDQVGLRTHFDSIIVSGEFGIHKPNTKIFMHILEQLDVPPERAIYVGDHPINDIKGAENTGMKGIWFTGFRDWDTSLGEPKSVISHLNELKEVVKAF